MAEYLQTNIFPPNGFVEIDRDSFFAILSKAGKIDPMPSSQSPPDIAVWETQKGPRITWGWSLPGWRAASRAEKRYAVLRRFAGQHND